MAAASEEGRVVTNGMSCWARDGENANAALLVGVGTGGFRSVHPLAGVEFQRKLEEAAYRQGAAGIVPRPSGWRISWQAGPAAG